MGEDEEFTDKFNGVHVWWICNYITQQDSDEKEKTSLTLTFYKWHHELVTTSYIQHVLEEGKAITMENRKLKLYTNNPTEDWSRFRRIWSSITFEHPARFETLATMISAIANFMNYNVYDLELTTIKDNNELKRLLISTTSKSIIVIEDIDCSIDLTGKIKKNKYYPTEENKVTLSGLLNIIDGIWSACGGERIVILSTNFVDKLDPALIRKGRMDMHIELSYCSFEAFKVLAKNYWDVESHDGLFPVIEKLIGETNITLDDVVENLMPKLISHILIDISKLGIWSIEYTWFIVPSGKCIL